MTDGAAEVCSAVHQLVGYLAEFSPTYLGELEGRHPEARGLRPGRTLGPLSTPAALRLDVAVIGLRAMVEHGDRLVDRLARRIRFSHRVELLAQLGGLIGSGGVLAVLLGDAGNRLKIASAVLGLIGSGTAVAVKFLRRDLAGLDNGIVGQHAAIVKAVGQAIGLSTRLLPYQSSGDDLGEPNALAQAVDEANALAGQLYVLAKQVGEPSVHRPLLARP